MGMNPAGLMLGALLSMAALLSGCSAGPGPLVPADSGFAQICMPARQGEWINMGWAVENHGDTPVTIKSVRLPADASHLQMTTKTWLVPPYYVAKTKTHFLGGGVTGGPYPPPARTRNWDKRRPAVGAIIGPHQTDTLAAGLMRTSARTARSGGPVIIYSADGTTFTWQEDISVVLANDCTMPGVPHVPPAPSHD